MSSRLFTLLAFCLCTAAPLRAANQNIDAVIAGVKWVNGPAKGSLGSIAEIQVPAGYRFTETTGTKTLLEAFGNLTSGRELGWLETTNGDWAVIFEFNDSGYVKDDDKDKLDAAKMLKTISDGQESANEVRKERGGAAITIVGWEMPPKYNDQTKNLEWAIKALSEGHPILNYNTRILGRKGVMSATLMCRPDKLAEILPTYQQALTGYAYKDGERYAEFRDGDKMAKYGLAALVTGGAAAVAAKLGFFGWLAVFFKKAWKLIVLGVAAVGGFFKNLIFGKDRNKEPEPPVMPHG